MTVPHVYVVVAIPESDCDPYLTVFTTRAAATEFALDSEEIDYQDGIKRSYSVQRHLVRDSFMRHPAVVAKYGLEERE